MNKAILPKFARPLRYEIKLDVDLPNFKYTGSQTVDLEIINILIRSKLMELTLK